MTRRGRRSASPGHPFRGSGHGPALVECRIPGPAGGVPWRTSRTMALPTPPSQRPLTGRGAGQPHPLPPGLPGPAAPAPEGPGCRPPGSVASARSRAASTSRLAAIEGHHPKARSGSRPGNCTGRAARVAGMARGRTRADWAISRAASRRGQDKLAAGPVGGALCLSTPPAAPGQGSRGEGQLAGSAETSWIHGVPTPRERAGPPGGARPAGRTAPRRRLPWRMTSPGLQAAVSPARAAGTQTSAWPQYCPQLPTIPDIAAICATVGKWPRSGRNSRLKNGYDPAITGELPEERATARFGLAAPVEPDG